LLSLPSFSAQEFAYLARVESAVRLDDIVLRRTTLAFAGELDEARVSEIASVVGAELGWSDVRRDAEIEHTWHLLREQHGVDPTRVLFR
jgi:glycerol-3-phosphate dehydrogenase